MRHPRRGGLRAEINVSPQEVSLREAGRIGSSVTDSRSLFSTASTNYQRRRISTEPMKLNSPEGMDIEFEEDEMGHAKVKPNPDEQLPLDVCSND
jgi:hypothetical protein